jgi:hypothetical protein
MFESSEEVVAEIARTCVYTLSVSPHTSTFGTWMVLIGAAPRSDHEDALGLLHDPLAERVPRIGGTAWVVKRSAIRMWNYPRQIEGVPPVVGAQLW